MTYTRERKWQGVSISTLIWLYLKVQHNTHFDSINWNCRQPRHLSDHLNQIVNERILIINLKHIYIKNIAILFIILFTVKPNLSDIQSFGGSCLGVYLGSHHQKLSSTDFHPSAKNSRDYQEQDKIYLKNLEAISTHLSINLCLCLRAK